MDVRSIPGVLVIMSCADMVIVLSSEGFDLSQLSSWSGDCAASILAVVRSIRSDLVAMTSADSVTVRDEACSALIPCSFVSVT